ncbi:uncharacterized protein A1O5_03176 [Cladophialophora psammophila CBS 110553]|uniref:30S ribosomal protein S17 n=1 Tax=Cladophialophora psammophila CBS 110553 TaxID=1182543 RepID=W9X929_9EURO|nr:uncharacterized protein A1O5_03176 [Cladophialophora psammophila CBS 110553]EXJ73416.1 hypothetical protein A1O5_03176 [Cladophialophora psammophila CBS 110553]
MNPSSATTFARACACACAGRARPTAPQSLLLVLRTQSTAPSLVASRGTNRHLSSRCRKVPVQQQQQQQRTFSSTCLLHRAQPITDLPPPASSEGLDASMILGKSSGDGSNIAPSILSRASTDPDSKGSSSTSVPQRSSQSPPTPPPSLQNEKTTTSSSSSWDPSLIYPSSSSSHEIAARDAAFLSTSPTLVGTVSRVGTMQKTVRVTRQIQVWHAHFQKHYTRPTHSLVHDPHNLLLEGDVIRFGAFPPSMREERDRRGQVVVKRHRPRDRNGVVKEQGVRYIVREVISPFGVPLEQRQPRAVGSDKGRWLGTEGEMKKLALRQKGRRDGKGASASTTSTSTSRTSRAKAGAVKGRGGSAANPVPA